MKYSNRTTKLEDCRTAGAGSRTELFLVEGDSAAAAVSRLRDADFQAVLPMQGKPLNAIKASSRKVAGYPLFAKLADALGTGVGDDFHLAAVRYHRILLLFDPDADGIHCGALMAMYFYRWMPALIEADRIEIVRAPVAEIQTDRARAPEYPLSDEEFHIICNRERSAGNPNLRTRHFRGLAGIDAEILLHYCIRPSSRLAFPLTADDARAAIEIFC